MALGKTQVKSIIIFFILRSTTGWQDYRQTERLRIDGKKKSAYSPAFIQATWGRAAHTEREWMGRLPDY
jgi:hypothetical protein